MERRRHQLQSLEAEKQQPSSPLGDWNLMMMINMEHTRADQQSNIRIHFRIEPCRVNEIQELSQSSRAIITDDVSPIKVPFSLITYPCETEQGEEGNPALSPRLI